jgi:hypothetical protein
MNMVRLFVAIATLVLLQPSPLRASELAKAHPDLAAKLPGIKTVLLPPPRIEMYEIGAGGTPEKMEEWGTAAQTNVSHAFSACTPPLAPFRLTELDEDSLAPAVRETYDETRLLYELVAGNITNHTYENYSPSYFPAKASKFVYSLGPALDQVAPTTDAILLIEGFDQRTSSGNKALQAGTMLIGLLLGAVVIPRGGGNIMTVALVEAKTGTILWFYRTQYRYDLRDPSSAASFAEDVLKELTTPGK